jgi:hypothetical protein
MILQGHLQEEQLTPSEVTTFIKQLHIFPSQLTYYTTTNTVLLWLTYVRTSGGPKIRGTVKKIYLKCLYKFETLVPFKVVPL